MRSKKLIILIVLCISVFIAFFIISSKDEDIQNEAQDPYIYVDQNNVDNIKVFTFDCALQGEVSFAYSEKIGWCLDHTEAIPLDDQRVKSIISTYSTIVASKKIDSPSNDLSEYGLDKPSYSVSIKISGKIKRYFFGNYTEKLDCYYFKSENSSNIYLVPDTYIEDLKISVLDLLKPNELPDLGNIQKVEFTSVFGAKTQVSIENDNGLISALSEIEIDYAVGYKEESYHTFSLDRPAIAHVEYLDHDDSLKTITIYFGRGASDDITYILSPGTQIVCVLKCDNIEALLNAIDLADTTD